MQAAKSWLLMEHVLKNAMLMRMISLKRMIANAYTMPSAKMARVSKKMVHVLLLEMIVLMMLRSTLSIQRIITNACF